MAYSEEVKMDKAGDAECGSRIKKFKNIQNDGNFHYSGGIGCTSEKRILIVPTLGLMYEGMTSVIFNYISNMDLSGMQIDILIFKDNPKEIRKRFSKYVNVVVSPERKRETRAYVRFMTELLKKNRYDVVHIHGNSGTMMIEALLARKYKVKKILVHCHTTQCDHPCLNIVMRFIMKAAATDFLACSHDAGRFLYGKSKFIVFNNAIDLDRFRYDPNVRAEVRKEFGIGDECLVGHIGHFSPQKNHFFLIDVFEAFHKMHPKSKLLLVSDGPDFDRVKAKVEGLGLDSAVIFAGRRGDCDRLYQAMDLFCFPSRWEGLGVAAIEAQATALPCLVSDAVPKAARCTDRIFHMSIAEGADAWAEKMGWILEQQFDRNNPVIDQIKRHGFDICVEANKMRDLYLGEGQETLS